MQMKRRFDPPKETCKVPESVKRQTEAAERAKTSEKSARVMLSLLSACVPARRGQERESAAQELRAEWQ